ncbi:HNH endonuclease [Tsukamurella tyrosinosolvens]|uniref:HNH endonuclease n=1 Tax=Tsukamurella tyrosinosolvens TaxID=57704 RepID=UPI002DD45282|nr:HNH endonuclease [Tsukamurella tyrosinosolvens]MEC4611819.1 HNH endonuclease [Tsukamurella tyrosinosolvens]
MTNNQHLACDHPQTPRARRQCSRSDPEYRDRQNKLRREWRERNKDKENLRKRGRNPIYRERYATDVEYRNRKKNRDVRRRLQDGLPFENIEWETVFERDGWVCQLCGDSVDPDLKFPHRMSASLDHIVPLSKGGEHSIGNVQLAHFSCNSQKGDK